MVERYLVANGSVHDSASWDGGSLPSASDDCHANGFTGNISADFTVGSLRTDAGVTASSGGVFEINASSGDIVLTCDLIGGIGNVVQCNPHAHTLTINGDITGGTGSSRGLWWRSGAGSLVVNGNITGGSGNTTQAIEVATTLASVLIDGNVSGGTQVSTYGLKLVTVTDSVTITGNVTGGTNQLSSYGLLLTAVSGADVDVLGNAVAGTTRYAAAIRNEGTKICTVGGLVYTQDASNSSAVNPPLDGRCFRIAEGGTITMRDSTGSDVVFTAGGGGTPTTFHPLKSRALGPG